MATESPTLGVKRAAPETEKSPPPSA